MRHGSAGPSVRMMMNLFNKVGALQCFFFFFLARKNKTLQSRVAGRLPRNPEKQFAPQKDLFVFPRLAGIFIPPVNYQPLFLGVSGLPFQ